MTRAAGTAARRAAIALALSLAACARVPPADLSRDPAALLGQVAAAQRRVQRVSGSARLKIASPGLSGTVTEFIAAEKPDRVHLETLDFFGNPAAVLVASGGQFAFLDAREGVYYQGDATPDNVSRLLPIAIPLEELVTLLCGSAPLLPGEPREVEVKDGQVLLRIAAASNAGGTLVQTLALGELASVEWSRLRLQALAVRGERPREASPAYDLEFGLFRHRASVLFPTEVHLDAPAGRSHVDLAWKGDLEVNGPLDPSLFRLAPPKGARVVRLGAGEGLPAGAPPLPEGPPERETAPAPPGSSR